MKDFVPYNESLELKELGFDEECFRYGDSDSSYIDTPSSIEERMINPFNKTIKIPTYSQAFRFFRDNFNLEPQVKSWKEKGGIVWHYSIQKIGEPSIFRSSDCAVDSHDEAQLICLQKLIQIVKNEKHTHITRNT